jgi:hypothetical protein
MAADFDFPVAGPRGTCHGGPFRLGRIARICQHDKHDKLSRRRKPHQVSGFTVDQSSDIVG